MEILAYAGISFAALGLGAGIPAGDWEGPALDSIDIERRGYSPLHIGTSRGARLLTVQAMPGVGVTVEAAIHNMLAAFDPYDDTERLLQGRLNDGTAVQLWATIGQYRGTAGNQVVIPFTIADPIWRKPSPDLFGPVTWPATGQAVLAVPNAGKARANLIVTIRPTANDAGAEFQYKRSFTITNNADMPLRRHPLEIPLGNTTAWGGSDTNPTHVFLLQDGIIQPNTLIGWRKAASYLWMLVDELAAGAALTYEIAWPRSSTTSPQLTGTDAPAFDLSWDTGTLTGTPTGTSMSDAGKTWVAGQWARGRVRILTGTGAGQETFVTANTATGLTLSPALTTVPVAGSTYLLRRSSNDRWVYAVEQTERSGPEDKRGLWYINRGQTKPSRAEFDVPGSWHRLLYLDNNDEKNQSRWCPIVPTGGGSDVDYYAILDADRTVQGWTLLQEEGQADSVAFSSPVPILGWRFNYNFKNPNGIGHAFFGARESGAEDWEAVWEDFAISAGLSPSGMIDMSMSADMRHLLAHLGPANEQAMPTSWIRDTGTWTGGGGTTLYDDTKSWATDQWVGASCRISSGRAQGKMRKVTSNDSVHVVLASDWGTPQPGEDSRYELLNPVLVATLRCLDAWEVRLDTSKTAISAVSAEAVNYDLQAQIGLSADPFGTVPMQVITIAVAGPTGMRRVMCGTGQELRIDGVTRRAALYTTATGAFVRDVTSAVDVTILDPSGNDALAADWLLVQPTPANPLGNPVFATDISGWAQFSVDAGITQSASFDSAVYGVAAGSLKVSITASTAAAGSRVIYAAPAAPPYLTVAPGHVLTVTAWGRGVGTNWYPQVGLAWYDSTNGLLGTSLPAVSGPPVAATGRTVAFTATVPANATYARVLLIATAWAANATDTVNFDDVGWDTSALYLQVPFNEVTTEVSAQLTEGWHG